ncbi:hypothetical protein P2L35_13995 [Enterococcus faecium]|nr:hypothetical protein [Enterococcus faecium]
MGDPTVIEASSAPPRYRERCVIRPQTQPGRVRDRRRGPCAQRRS